MVISKALIQENLAKAQQAHVQILRTALIEAGVTIGRSEGTVQILGQLLSVLEQPEPVAPGEPQLAETEPPLDTADCPASPSEAGTDGEGEGE